MTAAHFGRGPDAATELAAAGVDVIVVVDVLRFTTTVDVAVSRGIAIEPRPWGEPAGDEHRWALSPTALRDTPFQPRVVVPSPNGAQVSAIAASGGGTVLAACLRNASAVARAAASLGESIGVVASDERRRDGSLRRAIEDQLGASAVLAALGEPTDMPGADELEELLLGCPSGVELVERGLEADVRFAAELDVSDSVPILRDGAYVRLELPA